MREYFLNEVSDGLFDMLKNEGARSTCLIRLALEIGKRQCASFFIEGQASEVDCTLKTKGQSPLTPPGAQVDMKAAYSTCKTRGGSPRTVCSVVADGPTAPTVHAFADKHEQ